MKRFYAFSTAFSNLQLVYVGQNALREVFRGNVEVVSVNRLVEGLSPHISSYSDGGFQLTRLGKAACLKESLVAVKTGEKASTSVVWLPYTEYKSQRSEGEHMCTGGKRGRDAKSEKGERHRRKRAGHPSSCVARPVL